MVTVTSAHLIGELTPGQNYFFRIEILYLMTMDHGAQTQPLSPAQQLPINPCCRGLGHFDCTETVISWEAEFPLRGETTAQKD